MSAGVYGDLKFLTLDRWGYIEVELLRVKVSPCCSGLILLLMVKMSLLLYKALSILIVELKVFLSYCHLFWLTKIVHGV